MKEIIQKREEEFDKKFNHDNPNGVAIVFIETNEDGSTSQRPAQHDLKNFQKETIKQVLEAIVEWEGIEAFSKTKGNKNDTVKVLWEKSGFISAKHSTINHIYNIIKELE